MVILNFSHPLTLEQIEQLKEKLHVSTFTVETVPVQIDQTQPLTPQIEQLMHFLTTLHVSADKVILHLPGFAPAAACVIAQFYHMTERWPRFIRLTPVHAVGQTRYDIFEIVDLEEVAQF
jgi:hypothetical protein